MTRRILVAGVVALVCCVVPGVALGASSPSVVTDSATHVTGTSAVLNGTVNPNGASTTYTFAWGLTSGYGYASKPLSAGRGTKAVSVHVTITGLVPGTPYHFRLIALNGSGSSLGADKAFSTTGHPPAGVFTGPPIALSSSSATLSGTVNPNGVATSWFFQYGTTPALGLSTGGGTVPAGAPLTVEQSVSGLASGTLFYYRLVGLHGSSIVSNGLIQSFITYPSPRPRPHVSARTTPGRARHRPFVFTVSGGVSAPSPIPSATACSGSNVVITWYFNHHKKGFVAAPVLSNCTFTARLVLPEKFGSRKERRTRERIGITVHFRGNGYLAPADARVEHVTIG